MAVLTYTDDVLTSAELACLQRFARCGQCQGRSASLFDDEGNRLTDEQAASLQWVRCAQCRVGTHDWFRR